MLGRQNKRILEEMKLIWPKCELQIQRETLSKTKIQINMWRVVEEATTLTLGLPLYGFIGTSCSQIHEYTYHIHIHTHMHTNTHVI